MAKAVRDACLSGPPPRPALLRQCDECAGTRTDPLGLGEMSEALLDALPFFFLAVDSAHTIHFANRAVRDALGERGQHLTGAYCPTAMHGLEHPFPGCPLEEAAERHAIVERELFDEASKTWVSSSIYPTEIRSRAGLPVFSHVVHDITARRAAEAAAADAAAVEQLIARLSARFLAATPARIDQELNEALRMIAEFMGCTRYAAYFVGDAPERLDRRYAWQSPFHASECGPLPSALSMSEASRRADPDQASSPRHQAREPGDGAPTPREHSAFVAIYRGGALKGLAHFSEWAPTQGARPSDPHLLKLLSTTLSVALERLHAAQELSAYAERLRCMALELSAAEERERRRIASDLHDQIGQTLALSMMKVSSLRSQASTSKLADALTEVHSHIESALSDAKSLMFELSPPVLHQFGLGAALEWLLEQCSVRYGLICKLENDAGPTFLGDDEKIFLFRAAQELVANVHRHARARRVDVSLARRNGRLEILVADDGVGIPASGRSAASRGGARGFGLFSIEERISHLGGAMHVDSAPGAGTRITLELPESGGHTAGMAR